jgi:Tol biopolymer transport system component
MFPVKQGVACFLAVFALAATAGAQASPARVAGSVFNPAWSPDGKLIAWRQVVAGAESRIWIAAPNMAKAHPVTPPIDALGQIAWLPGHRLMYWANFRLFVLKPGGSSSLISVNGGDGFSLDRRGTRVATGVPGCPMCAGPIAVTNIKGVSLRSLGGRTVQNTSPSLLANGKRVAFARSFCIPTGGECDHAAGIWIGSIADGALQQVTHSGNCPTWSANGRNIAYIESDFSLRVVPATGGASTVLVPHVSCNTSFLPAWSPASINVAAVANDGRLMVADALKHRSSAVTGIGIGSVDGFTWSPDSRKVLVAARPFAPSSCSSLWLVTLKTRAARLLRHC